MPEARCRQSPRINTTAHEVDDLLRSHVMRQDIDILRHPQRLESPTALEKVMTFPATWRVSLCSHDSLDLLRHFLRHSILGVHDRLSRGKKLQTCVRAPVVVTQVLFHIPRVLPVTRESVDEQDNALREVSTHKWSVMPVYHHLSSTT